MASTAPMIAAAAGSARRRIRSVFEQAEAFSPETAIGFEPRRRLERRMFERLQSRGIIIATPDGRFYADRQGWADHDRRRIKRVLALAGAGLVAGVAMLGFSQV